MDFVTLALANKYTQDTVIGMGAIKGDPGEDGDSAYQIAVENGFVGNQEEWLASLKGDKGDTQFFSFHINNDGDLVMTYDEQSLSTPSFSIDDNGHLVQTITGGQSIDYGRVVGQGIPSGGTTGQILVKRSNSDFDVEWVTLPS